MIFRILLRYILGYVNISVEGYYIERFINTCVSKSILLWNVKREKSTYMNANVRNTRLQKVKTSSKENQVQDEDRGKKGYAILNE